MTDFDRVELILSSTGGLAMRAAVRRAHVWAVQSHENDRTADSLFASNLGDRISLTTMTIPLDSGPAGLETLLGLALEHHPKVDQIAIVGYAGNVPEADTLLRENGFVRLNAVNLEYRRDGR